MPNRNPIEMEQVVPEKYVKNSKKKKDNPNFRVGPRNAEVAKFYRLAVDGKRGNIAFPNAESKSFYIDCLSAAIQSFPIEILAYSVLNNRAYFVIATTKTPVSHNRWIAEANSEYAKYYNKYFKGAGYVFKSTIRSKKIADYMDVAESIMIVHSQPYASGLSDSYSYDFSSYKEDSSRQLANLNAFYWAAGMEEAERMLGIAHNMGPRSIPADFVNLPEIEKFDQSLENILCDYKVINKSAIPGETMCRVITELNERGGYTYDLLHQTHLQKENQYEMLIEVIVDLAITFSQTYDESITNLGNICLSNKAKEVLLDGNRTK